MMSDPTSDLVEQLRQLGVSERSARYALMVSLRSISHHQPLADDYLSIKRTNNDVSKAADYGACLSLVAVSGRLSSSLPETCLSSVRQSMYLSTLVRIS